jgi:hypothetical protein
MTTGVFGGKSKDAPPKRECIEEEFVEGLTESRCESRMMNTLPNVGRRRTNESNSTGSPVEGGIKPSKRTKEVTCFGSREQGKRYISDSDKSMERTERTPNGSYRSGRKSKRQYLSRDR